jgi:transposase InsO family protein
MTEIEQQRKIRHRLAVLRHYREVTGNVAKTCRYYGISRPTFYKWLHRFEEHGEQGLRDGSSCPHHIPHATKSEVVAKIVYLRQNYHFGPQKIAMYLARYHDITVSASGVWRILKRLEMNRLPASQRYVRHKKRWTRYEKPLPGHQILSRCEVHLSRSANAAASTANSPPSTIAPESGSCGSIPATIKRRRSEFLDYLLERFPFSVESIQTDNGAEFQTGPHGHVLHRGIRHVYIKPATPRLNGKVERSHRIDSEEFCRLLEGVVIDDTGLFNDKLREWEDYYNFHRPHGGLGGQTPYERLRQKSTAST